jgi:Tol biopolymer transport system component
MLKPNTAAQRFIADCRDPTTLTSDLWLYDASGGNPARFTFDPATDINSVRSPDGSRIIWTSKFSSDPSHQQARW